MAELGVSSPLDLVAVQSTKKDNAFRFSDVETREQAEKLAQEFESMFITEMLQPMFSQIKSDGPFGGGQGEEAFRPMLTEQYAKQLSEAGGIGIAQNVLTEILRMQGLEE